MCTALCFGLSPPPFCFGSFLDCTNCLPSPSRTWAFLIHEFQSLKRHVKRANTPLMMATLTSMVWNYHPHSRHRERGILLTPSLNTDRQPLQKCKQLHFKWDLCITKQHIVIKKNILCYGKDYEMPRRPIKHD